MTSRLTIDAGERRIDAALARLNRNIVRGWSTGGVWVESPDERFARENGFKVEVEPTTRAGKPVKVKRVILKGAKARLKEIVRERIPAGGLSDPTVAVRVDNGRRELLILSLPDRLAQAVVSTLVSEHLEAAGFFADGSHGFRRGRGVMSALRAARRAARGGLRFVHKKDVRKFYPSISVPVLSTALGSLDQLLSDQVTERLCSAFVDVGVLGRSGFRTNPDALFLGAPLAPLLSNIVATLLIDRVVEVEFGGRVVLIRYADDLLLLSDDRALVVEAVAVIEQSLLEASGGQLVLHPKKGTPEPVDLADGPLDYLGLGLHGGQIVVPQRAQDRAFRRLLQAHRRRGEEVAVIAQSFSGQLRFLKPRAREGLIRRLVRCGVRRGDLAPLRRSQPTGSLPDGEGPTHLTVRHRQAVVDHAAGDQLALPGVMLNAGESS